MDGSSTNSDLDTTENRKCLNNSNDQETTGDTSDSFNLSEDELFSFDAILRLLFKTTNIDFSHYRKTTVLRRLSRRMAMNKSQTFKEYLSFINSNEDEINFLYDDLLLSYTEFFREPFVFDLLKERVFPSLIEQRSTKDTIRIWVPGCSTGEEVYSLAICFQEFLQESNSNVNLKAQFFGTDLNPRHITAARSALYTDKIRKNLSPQRIEQFFDQTEDGLKVTKHIREMCVFAVQNVTQDPPFSNIDMVSCRNVLIYFDISFQDMAIPLFHFSLRTDGFLLLGSSETMGRFQDLFIVVDPKINLFSKRRSQFKSIYRFPVNSHSTKYFEVPEKIQADDKLSTTKPDINNQIDAIILDTYTPPCVLVDSNLILRQFRGHVFPYIQPISGDASLKLSKMVGEHLMPELYVAIEEAKKKNSLVKKNNILFKHSDAVYTINISVVPIHDNARKEQCYLIVFEKTVNSNFTVIDSIGNDTYNEELQKLRDELRSTKEHLQSIIEEKDEVNQELWASNEEVQSTNEELQSVNEEMEAAKEELESSNEELLALNEELRSKNSELNAAKYFSDNIVETARAIFITTDVNLKISSVNSFAEQLTGYSRNEIIGKNCMTVFFSQSTSDPSINFFNELLTDKIDSCQFDNRLVISDGSDRLISWRCSILKDANSFRYRILMIGFDITRQRIAEISLAESENNYRELVETSQDLIWQSDSEGRYTYLNPACEEIFEYEINEMLGKFIFDFESPETTAPLKKMLQHLHSGEVIKGYETIQLNKSGKNIHLNMYAVPEYADNETLKKIRGTAHNVTNWKRSESQYQRLFSEMLDGFALHEIICDTSGKPVDYKFLSINPAFEHQTGLKAEIIIGKTVREILPKVEESWINTYGEVALTGKPALFENYSSDLHKYFTVRAYRPAHHQFACIISDVTEQKCAEITLKNLLERFDQLSLQTKTFLWETDTVGLLTFVSPSIKNILGYTPEEIIGNLHFYDLHPDEGRDSFRESVLKMMKEHKNFIDYQNIIVTKDNQQVWVSVYATPHFNSDGELVGYRGGNTDISERKNSETIRQKLEQQHQQTQRLESLGVLAGGIAPDFNNLLGGIFGFIDLAIDECKQTKGVQYLTTALSTIERARSLTQQLLTFAKGGSPVKSVGNLFPFLQDTVKFVLSGSNVSCRFEIDPNLKPCDFDKNQIGQVFDNIIINAMQAMPMGGMIHLAAKNVCIPANFHSSLKEGEHVKISVSDSGIGIPPDLISRIFDPFFTTKTKGHGLGLATCYSIVTRHGGYIEAESVLGKGSTFHVYLPVSQETTSPIITEKPIRHSGKGIFLVMDDEEVIRMTMETMLSLFGYNVVCKESGQDTLNFFFESLNSDSVISGIILDLTIPGGMGGKEVIEEIRKLDKNIPVFVSSGYADDPVMSDPEKYGFTGSICKPFRIMDLTKLLSVHIDTNHKITDENGIN